MRELVACAALGLGAWGASASLPAPASAQTIRGTLMDVENDRPISLGLVMMFSEDGDSVTSTISDESGRFSISSPEPGSFILLASALGYRETPAGIFDLGEDGVMTVEYRLPPQPLPIDELVVSLNRPVLEHSLIRNGFVRRLQRGLGEFITPHEIEESPATSTEMLLSGIPGVSVTSSGILTQLGDRVRIRGPDGGWCDPTVFVDGVRVQYDYASGISLSQLVPLASVEGIEVYRRPSEIPVEYGVTQSGGGGGLGACGVLVFWTRRR